MISLLLVAAAAVAPECVKPADLVAARQCDGAAQAAAGDYAKALESYDQAARQAQGNGDVRGPALLVLAGNAALAAKQPARAVALIDAALATGRLQGQDLGEAHLDRARAHEALRNVAAARADLDQATRLAPDDPLAWLLSATLARRQNDLTRAQADIGKAMALSPDDAAVALEAGNIAISAGREDAARTAWEAAVRLQPNSAAATSARENLTGLGK